MIFKFYLTGKKYRIWNDFNLIIINGIKWTKNADRMAEMLSSSVDFIKHRTFILLLLNVLLLRDFRFSEFMSSFFGLKFLRFVYFKIWGFLLFLFLKKNGEKKTRMRFIILNPTVNLRGNRWQMTAEHRHTSKAGVRRHLVADLGTFSFINLPWDSRYGGGNVVNYAFYKFLLDCLFNTKKGHFSRLQVPTV